MAVLSPQKRAQLRVQMVGRHRMRQDGIDASVEQVARRGACADELERDQRHF